MSLALVPNDQIATIVTSLEMRERPRLTPMPPAPLALVPWRNPSCDKYRALFRRVGERWMWFSRQVMDDAALSAIIGDERVAVYAVVDRARIEVGMLELDHREPGTCEISFFGLVPELNGKGYGRWLMGQALALGWRRETQRMWVHTCTLDHPSALGFYRKQGFVPFSRAVEIFADPRVAGIMPRDAAPQIPLLDASRR